MSKNTSAVDRAPPDRRLILEKGGYRPDVLGKTLPPAKPSGPGAGDRPLLTNVKTTPPTKPSAPATEHKK